MMTKPLWMWAVFLGLVLFLLILDLGILHRRDEEISARDSVYMFIFYTTIGFLFGLWVWWQLGIQKAIEYGTGFVIEKTLALDNIFVIAMILSYFQIPRMYQHRVLFWGILGVIVLRGIMIGCGAALVENFSWVLYIFGLFLIFTGIKMFFVSEKEHNLADNVVLKFIQSHFRITKGFHGHDFFVKREGLWHITPLFVALVMIEIADVIFAVDSIPAIFAITIDPYIVYTSNIFAILGLRSLYFMLSAMINRFIYLKYALSVVLIFIGSKIFIDWGAENILHIHEFKFPPLLSLVITLGILGLGICASLWKTKNTTH